MFKRNKEWIFSFVFSSILLIYTFSKDEILAIQYSVYLGIFFLILTLLPSNIAKLKLGSVSTNAARLVKLRRNFGITSGLLFLLHGVFANLSFRGFNLSFVLAREVILGFFALLIFVALLLTSSQYSLVKLKSNWKKIHSLVWVAVPMALVHSILASEFFVRKLSFVGILGFSLIVLFVFMEFLIHKRNGTSDKLLDKRHLHYTILGLMIGILFLAFYF